MDSTAGPSNGAAAAASPLVTGDRHKRAKRIASYNFKGGVSKTTQVVNLAAALVLLGYKVVVIDADAQCNLTVHMARVPGDPEELPPRRPRSQRKRRRAEPEPEAEPEAAATEDAEASEAENPPQQEVADEADDAIFPARLKDRLGPAGDAPQAVPDLEHLVNNKPTIHDYISTFLTIYEPELDLAEVDMPGLPCGQLLLVPGSPKTNLLDWSINGIKPDCDDAPAKQACWQRLYCAIEEKYQPDFILTDLNPAASKFNYLATIFCDFILPAVAAGLYDASSSENFLDQGITAMFTYAQGILKVQHQLEQNNPNLAARFLKEGLWFPRQVPAANKQDKGTTLPRMPKVLPFIVHRYKTSYDHLTQAASRYVNSLIQVVLDACNRLNDNSGDRAHPKFQLKNSIFFNQVSQHGPITTFDEAHNMVLPLVANIETVISMSHHLRKPIMCITEQEAKRFAAGRNDQLSKVRMLEYAQGKFKGLAESLVRLPMGPDFYYG